MCRVSSVVGRSDSSNTDQVESVPLKSRDLSGTDSTWSVLELSERPTTEDTRHMDLKLTTRTQEAMAAAVRRAATDGHPQVEPAHLLAALLDQADGVAP